MFNALEDTNYGPDTEVEFTTLEDAVYTNLKNDLGFIIDKQFIILTEHQAAINHNMPLRQLEYIARTYEKLVDAVALYGSKGSKSPLLNFCRLYRQSEVENNDIKII